MLVNIGAIFTLEFIAAWEFYAWDLSADICNLLNIVFEFISLTLNLFRIVTFYVEI